MRLAGLAKRLVGAAGLALVAGGLCGPLLVSDDVGETHGVRLAGPWRRSTLPAREATIVTAAGPAVAAPASSSVVAPPPVAVADPRDLARALPEPVAAAQLAAMLRDSDSEVAVAAAEALSVTRAGRPIVLAHLARPDDTPGLDHLTCLEALAVWGRLEDLPVVLPWATREDSIGDLAGWCVRTICERERVDVPAELRAPVPELDAAVRSGT